jgi:hypothetical protein
MLRRKDICMTPHGMSIIRDLFPMTKWAIDTSAKYRDAFSVLQVYEDSEIEAACRSLKRMIARGTIKPEEIQCEARRLRRIADIQARVATAEIDETEVEADRKSILSMLLLATREEIASAVAQCRRTTALTGEPLPSGVEAWTPYQRGVVWAAMDKQGVFR